MLIRHDKLLSFKINDLSKKPEKPRHKWPIEMLGGEEKFDILR